MSNFLCKGFVNRSVFSRNKVSVSEFLLTVRGQARFVFNLEAAPWPLLPGEAGQQLCVHSSAAGADGGPSPRA